MIELKHDSLIFSFPEVHPKAKLFVTFHRTLRIPDDDNTYPLPPSLGRFPLYHVDDFAKAVPQNWLRHGGVMMPMYQSEAMWLSFDSYNIDRQGEYPFAVQIATGKVDAITGEVWQGAGLKNSSDHLTVPEQPWLDGYCVEKGVIRQFVAMPLGAGYSVEEQITDKAEYGGLQIIAYPMKREAFERHFPKTSKPDGDFIECRCCIAGADMALAPGGRMHQEIYEDPYKLSDWDLETSSRCFVHINNSITWKAITGKTPPTPPPTAKEYTTHGLPWFSYYDDNLNAINRAEAFKHLKSVSEIGKIKGDVPLPENESVTPEKVIELRAALPKDQVREWSGA